MADEMDKTDKAKILFAGSVTNSIGSVYIDESSVSDGSKD